MTSLMDLSPYKWHLTLVIGKKSQLDIMKNMTDAEWDEMHDKAEATGCLLWPGWEMGDAQVFNFDVASKVSYNHAHDAVQHIISKFSIENSHIWKYYYRTTQDRQQIGNWP